jgi:hypothetical protein
LKASGVKLFILKYNKPLSNFAFKFNLRRYDEANTWLQVVLRNDDQDDEVRLTKYQTTMPATSSITFQF